MEVYRARGPRAGGPADPDLIQWATAVRAAAYLARISVGDMANPAGTWPGISPGRARAPAGLQGDT